MIYNKSLQGRFVSGKYTPAAVLLLAFAVWLCEISFAQRVPVSLPGFPVMLSHGIWSVLLSFLLCVAVVAVLRTNDFFERRVRLLPAMFVWLVVLLPVSNSSAVDMLSLLLLCISVTMLMASSQSASAERALFSTFAVLGTSSMMLPHFLLLLPLFLLYIGCSKSSGVRHFLAALLGFATPLWLLFGTLYVFPQWGILLCPFAVGLENLLLLQMPQFNWGYLLSALAELLLFLPAAVMFSSSSLPSKPLLRRKMQFIFLLNAYLFLLSPFAGVCNELFLLWRIPGLAVMSSYLFSFKFTKLTNILFVLLNLLWLAIAVLNICLNQL